MAITFDIFQRIFLDTQFLGVKWIIPTAAAALVILLITRDTEKLKVITLPVMMGMHIIGLRQNLIFMIIAGIVYVQEGLSINVIGGTISVFENFVELGGIGASYAAKVRQKRLKTYSDQRIDQKLEKQYFDKHGGISSLGIDRIRMTAQPTMKNIDKMMSSLGRTKEAKLEHIQQKKEEFQKDYKVRSIIEALKSQQIHIGNKLKFERDPVKIQQSLEELDKIKDKMGKLL